MKENSIEASKPLHRELINDIKDILDSHNLDMTKVFFLDQNKDSVISCHKEIMSLIADKIKDNATAKKIYLANMLFATASKKDSDKTSCNVSNIIDIYLGKFHEHLFTLNNGEIEFTNAENFSLPSTSRYLDSSKNMDYINSKLRKRKLSDELELIITQDGTTYFAPVDHQSLAYWLITQDIDLSEAIRIEAYREYSSFDFGSLQNFSFANMGLKNETITISDNQAKSIRTVYATLMTNWKGITSIEKALSFSNGLGLDKASYNEDNTESRQNLRTLGYYLDDIGFKPNKYLRELGFNGSIFDNYTINE